jgi:diguanylate cyclase (GGDEF)-like protein/PAS domain S-box-containing protein
MTDAAMTWNESTWRAMLDASLDAIITIDATGNIVEFSWAAERIFGHRRCDVLGRDLAEVIIPPAFRERHYAGLRRMVETGQGTVLDRRLELTALHADGHEFPVELTITAIPHNGQSLFTGFLRDITERRQAERAQQEARQQVQLLLDSVAEGIYGTDVNQNCTFVNTAFLRLLGYQDASEVIGKHIHSLIHHSHEDGSAYPASECRMYQAYTVGRTTHVDDEVFWRKDGSSFPVEYWSHPIIENGVSIGAVATFFDITERKLADQELRIAAAAFKSQEGMFITDAAGVILRVNNTFIETTGYSAADAVGQKPSILKSGRHDAAFYKTLQETLDRDGYWHGEIWNRRKNGEIYPEWQTITAVFDANGRVTHYVSAFSDISKRKEAEDQIRNLAFYDPLTRLPNRRLLMDRLQHALISSVRNKRQGALLFIDLDNFKTLNDTQGHDVGDLLLVEVSDRLKSCIRECDTAARLGGDEFVVLLENLEEDEAAAAAHAEAVGEKVRTCIELSSVIQGREHHGSASIGITLFRGDVLTAEEMIKRADVALYQAKGAGRNTLRFFDPALQAKVAARANLETDLREGIQQGQFVLHYQPQVDGNGRMTGAEALVRWRHPVRGMVSPADFIPLAEENGLILPLGQWVLETACAQLAVWAEQTDMAHLTLAVNVSARQFRHPNFVEQVLAALGHAGIDPKKLKLESQRLKLELTESMLLDDVESIIAKMNALKEHGVTFSLDDFGTGYSSLSYLKRLPLYQLKIDQSFVRDVLTDPNDAAIAQTIITLAHSMGLAVIAEGVETEAQREFLDIIGCRAYQGYLFSRPLPIEQFDALGHGDSILPVHG